jgi:hypothetical protein
MTHTVRRSGSWTPELIGAPGESAYPESYLATDPANAPAFLATSGSLVLIRRDAAGWYEEAIPTSGTSYADYAIVLLPAVDRVALVGRWSDAGGRTVIGIRERDPSGWYAAEPALTATYTWPAYAAAISPDGTRIAIATTNPPSVAIRDGGRWTVHPLATVDGGFALGFTPSGKLWILLGVADSPSYGGPALIPYVLYEEP